jgi:leader peptidase (prepilin peptidase) / N-methyltransferase
VQLPWPVLAAGVLLVALAVGPWLARIASRLAARDERARPTAVRIAVMTALLAGLLAGALELTGLRPATVALAWAAGAAVVLGAVDLASHRLPDRVTYPAYAVCGVALLVDAAVLGSWGELVRAAAAAAVTFLLAAGAAAISPAGLGFGDVKLLGLLGLLLGWAGWGVLLAGIFLGLLTGASVSLALLAIRRAGWRTALPFGPPLLAGAVLALALGAPGSLG